MTAEKVDPDPVKWQDRFSLLSLKGADGTADVGVVKPFSESIPKARQCQQDTPCLLGKRQTTPNQPLESHEVAVSQPYLFTERDTCKGLRVPPVKYDHCTRAKACVAPTVRTGRPFAPTERKNCETPYSQYPVI